MSTVAVRLGGPKPEGTWWAFPSAPQVEAGMRYDANGFNLDSSTREAQVPARQQLQPRSLTLPLTRYFCRAIPMCHRACAGCACWIQEQDSNLHRNVQSVASYLRRSWNGGGAAILRVRISVSIGGDRPLSLGRHGRACPAWPGHPRLACRNKVGKTWMPASAFPRVRSRPQVCLRAFSARLDRH